MNQKPLEYKVHSKREMIDPGHLKITDQTDIVDRSSHVDRQKLAVQMLRQGDHNETMRRLAQNVEELSLIESTENPFARNNLSLSEKRDMIDKTNKTIYEVNKAKRERSDQIREEAHNELLRKAAAYDNLEKNVDKSTSKEAS